MEKLARLTHIIRDLMDGKFTGYLRISFTRGNVLRVEKFEEILKSK